MYDRMERQRREEEVKTRSSKKGQEAEQAMMNRVWQVYLIVIDFNYLPCLSVILVLFCLGN